MHWNKKGRIFNPGDYDWAGSHAQVPTVLLLEDKLRIFYADRDKGGKSFITYIDVARDNPADILYCHKKPIIDRGKPGTFDDDGMMPSDIVRRGKELWLYYTGWNARNNVPYHNATGLIVSKDNGDSFQRLFDGPVMDRTPYEPYIAVTPCIVKEKQTYRMWYSSGLSWQKIDSKFEPVYGIKQAVSKDGIHWERNPTLCVEQAHPLEAISRPYVLKLDEGYHMWFSHRHSANFRGGEGSYRIGYAYSANGKDWRRDDARAGIELSHGDDWDGIMQCYPYIVRVEDKIWLFYNGNGFGRTGIGYAEYQQERFGN